MKVRDIMSAPVVTVTADTPFKEIVEQLVRTEVSSLPVMAADGSLAGIVTEADLISKEAYANQRSRALALLADVLAARDHRWVRKAAGSVARDVMTADVAVCRPDEDVQRVARRMLELSVKRMPVVDSDRLVGIVSRQDILGMFDRPDDAISADVARLLHSHLYMPEDHHVGFSVAGGVVTLMGDIRYAWDEPIVVSLVREIAGVVEVISHLHHRERNPRPAMVPPMFGAR